MALLLFYLFVALLFSFLCSVLEAVLLSITPFFIKLKLEEGKLLGHQLQNLKQDIDRPLGAILTLNTFAHTIGAAGVGAQAQHIWGDEYLSIVSAVMTVIILIFSEIIPKTIGASYWVKLTPFTVFMLRMLVIVLYPFVVIVPLITKLLKKKNAGQSHLSRDDFSTITDMGEKEGIIEKDESTVIKNILQFNKILVENIMTPRTVVFALDEEKSIKHAYQVSHNKAFSRIPVFSGSIDNVTGFVLKNDILIHFINKNVDKPLKDIKLNIPAINEQLPLPELFNRLLKDNAHIALVMDDYGGMAGIVTMEDIIETILGLEIMDEKDSIEDMQAFARETWKARARKMGLFFDESSPKPPKQQ